jgi:hypothetical protein
MAFRATNEMHRDYIKACGFKAPEPGAPFLWGMRGAVPLSPNSQELSLRNGRPFLYDDVIGIGGPIWRAYQGSVDPGSYYTAKPMNRKGAAHLVALDSEARRGNVYRYKKGMHGSGSRGRMAFVQAAGVNIIRDLDRDGIAEGFEPYQANVWIGLHIHDGGSNLDVGSWSAGCQVIRNVGGAYAEYRAAGYQFLQDEDDWLPYYLFTGDLYARHFGFLK